MVNVSIIYIMHFSWSCVSNLSFYFQASLLNYMTKWNQTWHQSWRSLYREIGQYQCVTFLWKYDYYSHSVCLSNKLHFQFFFEFSKNNKQTEEEGKHLTKYSMWYKIGWRLLATNGCPYFIHSELEGKLWPPDSKIKKSGTLPMHKMIAQSNCKFLCQIFERRAFQTGELGQ